MYLEGEVAAWIRETSQPGAPLLLGQEAFLGQETLEATCLILVFLCVPAPLCAALVQLFSMFPLSYESLVVLCSPQAQVTLLWQWTLHARYISTSLETVSEVGQ